MNQPEHPPELDETLRKIGRNVLYFQRMEAMLKFLISRSNLEGTASTLRSNHEKAIDAVSRHTLGNLVKGFFDTVHSKRPMEPEYTEIEETVISSSFRIEADPAYIEQRRAALSMVVEERNLLIHQLLGQLDQTSPESCRKLSALLDAQEEKMWPEYEILWSLVKKFQTCRKMVAEAMKEELANGGKTKSGSSAD